ncbi:MAG: hypothetical protein U5K77_03080 [Candidatus Saccharibacteria bacterium]|nr:hypothetical protein [Candidatus Saccharibacteria bacterium]
MKTKIRQFITVPKIFALALLIVLVMLGARGAVQAQAVSQGYNTEEQLQSGLIVKFDDEDTSYVEPLSIEFADQMLGVTVGQNDAPITLSDEENTIFVATTGRYDVIVSNQNGAINAGDYITISSLRGIGMKVDTSAPVVVGRALESFDGQDSFGTTEVSGKTVALGRVEVDITVARNPILKVEENVPEFLRRAAEQIAGKRVDALRVYVGLVIFIIGTAIAATLMYGGVKSGIISIGRNPLSKSSIIRSMVQVIIVGLIVFITSIFAVYLLLRL